jgi:DNA-binding SARP family transcriptional activator/FixJ family two-component response regulator
MAFGSNDSGRQLNHPPPPGAQPTERQLSDVIRLISVVVVEEDLSTASMIVTILQTSGYSVVHIRTIAALADYISNNAAALVLLDATRLSRADVEVVAQLHALRPNLPILAIFTRHDQALVVAAAELGLADYVTQPLDLSDLLFRISVVLAWRTGLRDLSSTVNTQLAAPVSQERAEQQVAEREVAPLSIASSQALSLLPGGAAAVEISCLGRFRLVVNGKLVCDDSSGGRRALLLLKYLILNLGRRVLKERIADLLWPDLSGDYAANNLRGTIYSLRQQLSLAGLEPGQYLHAERGSIYFDPGDDYFYDVERFTSLLEQAGLAERAGHWSEAVTLYEQASTVYQGTYLELDEGIEWVTYEQERLKERWMSALIRLADLYIETEEYEQAIAIAQRVVRADWRREAAHRILMVAYYKSERRNNALIAYQSVVDTFKENLGISPMQQTRDLAARILREERI